MATIEETVSKINLVKKAAMGQATVYPKCIHSFDGYCEKIHERCMTVICDEYNNNTAPCDMVSYEHG